MRRVLRMTFARNREWLVVAIVPKKIDPPAAAAIEKAALVKRPAGQSSLPLCTYELFPSSEAPFLRSANFSPKTVVRNPLGFHRLTSCGAI